MLKRGVPYLEGGGLSRVPATAIFVVTSALISCIKTTTKLVEGFRYKKKFLITCQPIFQGRRGGVLRINPFVEFFFDWLRLSGTQPSHVSHLTNRNIRNKKKQKKVEHLYQSIFITVKKIILPDPRVPAHPPHFVETASSSRDW